MKLLYPEFLILLFAVLFLYRHDRKAKLLYLSLALMIAALSRPVLSKTVHETRSMGVEAVIALDLSYSMRATDIKPSRLEAAKETIRSVLREENANRYALYGFTTNALILSPPTNDHTLLDTALDAVEEENILTHGTSLQALLKHLAKRAFPVENLILFSDGGEERDLAALVKIAKDAGIRIIAVGMATRGGALLHDSYGKVLKDANNALVVTKRNPLLKPLGEQSGGGYIDYADPQSTAAALLQKLHEIAETSVFSHQEQSFTELFWIPLLAALLLFFFHFVQLPRKWLALLPFVTLTADASVLDWLHLQKAERYYAVGDYQKAGSELEKLSSRTLQLAFDKALLAYREKKYKKSLAILNTLETRDKALKFKILFLKGNSYARLKRYTKARSAYRQALILQRDPDVLYNLKTILGKRDQTQPKPPVYQKKKSDKAGFASKERKSDTQKEQATQGKGKREKVRRPLGYKAYELINKGYIDEKKPW